MGRIALARFRAGHPEQRPTYRDQLKERLAQVERTVDHHRRAMEDSLAEAEELRYILGRLA